VTAEKFFDEELSIVKQNLGSKKCETKAIFK